jgi:anti-sigma B factor antagonist
MQVGRVPSADMTDGRESGSAAQLMQIALAQVGPSTVVSVTGEVDMLTAPRLASAVDTALGADDGAPVVVDLSRVSFFDSHGLTALIQEGPARRLARLRVVVGGAQPVIRPLQITGLDEVLPVYRTLHAALAGSDDAP